MMKYLNEYKKEINELIDKSNNKTNWKKVLENHRAQISFLQHERLIHLLVTLTFGISFIFLMLVTLVLTNWILVILDVLFLILLVPYIAHYYRLENGVQSLYRLDKIIEKKSE